MPVSRRTSWLIVSGLLFTQALVFLFLWRWQHAYSENVYRACVTRNQQWDAVVTKEKALLANARTSSVIAGVRSVYEDEVAVLERTRVNCTDLRAGSTP